MKQPVPSHLGWSHRTTAASHAHSNSQAMSFDYAGKRMSMGWGPGRAGGPSLPEKALIRTRSAYE